MRSVSRPKASASNRSRGPRSTFGWSRRARASATGARPIGIAPALGQQVVEHVVDRYRAEQPVVIVDDRRRHQVVGREMPGDVLERGVGTKGTGVLLAHAAD